MPTMLGTGPSPLGEFEIAVLMAAAHLDGHGYGSTIVREIERRTRRRIARGAVYITLDRLARKGLLSSELGESLPQRGGRPRRTYRLTPTGKHALRYAIRLFGRMQAGLDPLFTS